MAGFRFKIVDFNFKIVKMADFKSKWPALALKADFSFALDLSRVHTQTASCVQKAKLPKMAFDREVCHAKQSVTIGLQAYVGASAPWTLQRSMPKHRCVNPGAFVLLGPAGPWTLHKRRPVFKAKLPKMAFDRKVCHAKQSVTIGLQVCVGASAPWTLQGSIPKHRCVNPGAFALLGPAGPWTLQGSIPKRRPGASGAFELFQKVVAGSRTQGFGTHTGVPLRIELWQQSAVARACAGMSCYLQLHVPIPKSTST